MKAESKDKKVLSTIRFSVANYAAWAPGIETPAAWQAWANDNFIITGTKEPAIKAMPALLRRRVSTPGKMALEVAYQCLGEQTNIPIIFCSRHGECERSVELLNSLARNITLSPTAFSLSVHNATAGLFSIARQDHTNNIAIAANHSTIEHAIIEACGLLADDISAVLVVAYDTVLPTIFKDYQDCQEQPYAWAWLIQPPAKDVISLTWTGAQNHTISDTNREPAGLEVLRFFISKNSTLARISNNRLWQWVRHA